MRRNWFRNRLGRKNNQATRGQKFWKPRSRPSSFSGSLERLEERRLLSAISFSAGILTLNGDQDFVGENDSFILQRDSGDPTKLNVSVNANNGQFTLSSITQINVFGFSGNDTLRVDSSNGLIDVIDAINFDGGTGFDQLLLRQTGGPTISSDELSPGASPGSGASSVFDASNNQFIYFQNIEPVDDALPASIFVIAPGLAGASVLDGNNAINYTSQSGSGLVTIDNFEPISFTKKDHLDLFAGAGDDTINIQSGAAPTGDTSDFLQDITVRGNDPTASDTLIVNGTSGQDDIDYRPDTLGSGSVNVNSNPTINFTTIESLVIDGQGGNDQLAYIAPGNDGDGNNLTLTSSVVSDTSTITGHEVGGDQLTPLTFQHVGDGASIEFSNANEGRSDSLDVYGSAAADQFNLDPDDGGSLDVYRLDEPGNVRVMIEVLTPSISTLALHAADGDDQFNVVCMENNNVALPYDNLIIDGGNPSASDIVNLINPSGPVTVNLGNTALSTDTTITGFGGTITLQGDEVVNLSLNGQTLTVNGTSQPENVSYTPTGTLAGTFSVAGLNTVFNFSGVSDGTGAFLIDPMGGDRHRLRHQQQRRHRSRPERRQYFGASWHPANRLHRHRQHRKPGDRRQYRRRQPRRRQHQRTSHYSYYLRRRPRHQFAHVVWRHGH